MRLHLLVTGQHSPLSTALCFNYFSLFSLPPFPSLPTTLFYCDYSWERSHRGVGRWGGGVCFIGQQVKSSGKGQFYMAESLLVYLHSSQVTYAYWKYTAASFASAFWCFSGLLHKDSHAITPTHISLVEKLEKTWACGLFQRQFVLPFLVLLQTTLKDLQNSYFNVNMALW